MNETKNIETLLARMSDFARYFQNNIKNIPLFEPEYKIATAINRKLLSGKPLSRETAAAMLRLVYKLKPGQHYDGSGWGDYKSHLYNIFRLLGLKNITQHAARFDWKTESFPSDFSVLPFSRTFTAGEMDRIRAGFRPKEMEDRWFIYFEDNILQFHRSWTGHHIYQLHFSKEVENTIIQLVVNRNRSQYNYSTDEEDIIKVQRLLDQLLTPL